ncbi:membrane or secreted protein [Rhodocytophaga aerolata]|uniref:Membrane or secreted protein n=1 Tax=Rhodocytophaga aerolata TaxID=455078 RepID=A0ABT8R7C8_9BACT|nr:membrane or secreted protein [Rhodocytophaga aerolata]MDO1448004.1 membrane or secreted protein [Rhodocytophaga aerolata]
MQTPSTFVCLIFFSLAALTGFHFYSPTNQYADSSLAGAYRMTVKLGTSEVTAVKIVTGSYFTIAYYDLAGKKFAGTEGGTYSLNGTNLLENMEFNSMDSTTVGSTVTLKSVLKNGKWQLSGTKYGKTVNETWEKIPEESARNSPLRGAWRITQRVDPSTGSMSAMQQGPRKTIKMMSDTRFQWIAFNTATKQFSGTGGGTYTAKEGKYTETIEFFSRDPSRVGMQLSFDFEVNGRDWLHSGTSSTGNPIKEVWSNVDEVSN